MAATGKNLLNSDILFTDRRKVYLGEQMVKELWPEVTPFLTMARTWERVKHRIQTSRCSSIGLDSSTRKSPLGQSAQTWGPAVSLVTL